MGLLLSHELRVQMILDGLMRKTPDALRFIQRAADEGVGAVVTESDAAFGDDSKADPDDRPDPSHII